MYSDFEHAKNIFRQVKATTLGLMLNKASSRKKSGLVSLYGVHRNGRREQKTIGGSGAWKANQSFPLKMRVNTLQRNREKAGVSFNLYILKVTT